jgi:Na+(H+)/acetate symporter ActP
MKALHETRLKIRRELEAPPALRKFGSGWISGVLGMMFGLAALGCVVMMRFPGVFTMKENAALIGHPAFRTGMFVLMVLALCFHCSASCCVRARLSASPAWWRRCWQ